MSPMKCDFSLVICACLCAAAPAITSDDGSRRRRVLHDGYRPCQRAGRQIWAVKSDRRHCSVSTQSRSGGTEIGARETQHNAVRDDDFTRACGNASHLTGTQPPPRNYSCEDLKIRHLRSINCIITRRTIAGLLLRSCCCIIFKLRPHARQS